MEDAARITSIFSTTVSVSTTDLEAEKSISPMGLAQRELAAFVAAVTTLFGPEQASLAVTDWLDESAVMETPARSTIRGWRTVTIAASARLASRVNVAMPASHGGLPGDPQASPMPSLNCFSPTELL